LLHESPTEVTPLQRELDRTGKILGFVVLAIAAIMIVTIRRRRRAWPVRHSRRLILGCAAVAAVPKACRLSCGGAVDRCARMAKRNAIVRHLAAVETLGSASVIVG
jgi:Ca2+-transporting ATPase